MTMIREEIEERCKRESRDREPWAELGIIPDKWFRKNAHKYNYSVEHIVSRAISYHLHDEDSSHGIYFLIKDGIIKYVGQSSDVLYRLSFHIRDGRQFDKFWWFMAPPLYLNEIESFYIHTLNPPENYRIPPYFMMINILNGKNHEYC